MKIVQPKRILIVGLNWMGDLLLLTPSIRAIRKNYPHATIVCLVPPRGEAVLEDNPNLDRLIVYPESRGLSGWIGFWPLVFLLRSERFDAAFLFHPSGTRAMAAWLAGVKQRIGFKTKKGNCWLTRAVEMPSKDSTHKAAVYLRLVEAAGLKTDGFSCDAGIRDADEQAVDRLYQQIGLRSDRPAVAIHPAANWKLKRWPAESFARLADRLAREKQAQIVFIGTKNELPLVEQVRSRMQHQAFVAAGKTSFKELGALLKRMNLLITNDSGPMHLAAAVGTPLVGLFGPTLPSLSGPPSDPRFKTLHGSIGCPVPCYQLNCPANLCMEQISPDQVFAEAEKWLK